jgi:predicted RND superfamily exporter protein
VKERIYAFIVDRPVATLAIILALTAAFASQLPKLYTDTNFLNFLPPYDIEHENNALLETTFGSSYLTKIIVFREDHPDGIYNPETLALIEEITEWLRTRPEFETATTADLRSLSTLNDIRGDEEGMVVEAFMEEAPTDRAGALLVRERVENNENYRGVLASSDGKAASIFVREAIPGGEPVQSLARAATYLELREYLDGLNAQGHPEVFHLTGRPMIEGLFAKYIPEETVRMAPPLLLLIALCLFFSFRSPRGVLIPLVVLVASEFWMMGFLGAWGHPIYTVSSILPVLLMAIAIADSIHMMAKYYEAQAEAPEADRRTIVLRTLNEMDKPVLMTSITTGVGFLSMRSAPIIPIQDFGVIAVAAIAAALILSLTVIPAILMLLPLDGAARHTSAGQTAVSRFDRALTAPSLAAFRRPGLFLAAFAALLATALYGMTQLTTDSSQVKQFRKGHAIRIVDQIDNERFTGGTILDVILIGKEDDAFKDPELLRKVDQLQQGLESMAIVGDSLSIAELIKRMNRVMNEERESENRIPDSRELVAQYLLLYSISGDPGDFDDLIDYDYRRAHIMAFIRDPGTTIARGVVETTNALAEEIFADLGDGAPDVYFAGSTHLNIRMESYVVSTQITTAAVCLPALLLIAWFLFGRISLGILTVVPVSFTVLLIYGGMGMLGIPTDIGTTMLGGMTLGIGIDFAIHYLFRYRTARREGRDRESAIVETATTAGRALFYNAGVLFGGFSILLLSRMGPQARLGALVAATMLICYATTMILFPAVLKFLTVKD